MSPFDRRVLTHINWVLTVLVALLFGVGVLNLYSASGIRLADGLSFNPFYHKQLLWGLVGLAGMTVFMLFDYRRLKTLSWPIFIVTVALLLCVPLFGTTVYGAKRWISFGFFNIQPSELAKITVLIIGARILAARQGKLGWGELLTVLAVGLIPAGLVIIQPDLGSGLNILLLLGGLILYRGLTANVLKFLLVAVPAILPMGWFFLHDYQKRRILTFMDPGSDPRGSGWQIIHSQISRNIF